MMAKRLSLFACIVLGSVALVRCGSESPPPTNQTFTPESATGGGSSSGSTGGSQNLPPLQISTVTSKVTDTSVVISWLTNNLSDSTIDYGVSSFGITANVPTPTLTHSIALSNLGAGQYQYRVTSKDAAAHVVSDSGSGAGYRFIINTGPHITGVNSTVSGSTVTVTWTTDEATDSKVDIGTTDFTGQSQSDPTPVTTHSVPVTVTAGPGSYIFRITSKDSHSVTAVDDNNGKGFPFTIAGPGPQPTPDGSIGNPFVIAVSTSATFSDQRKTSDLGSVSNIDTYPSAIQDESGPEYVYTFTTTETLDFFATHSGDTPGVVDIDVMLCASISAADKTGTLVDEDADANESRGDVEVTHNALPAGTYFLVLDTFNSTTFHKILPGPYALSVTFSTPAP